MTLDAIDWDTITRQQAIKLRPAAIRRIRTVEDQFRNDQATERQLLDACDLDENLQVFIHAGLKPDQH